MMMSNHGSQHSNKRSIEDWNEIHAPFGITVLEQLSNGKYRCACDRGHEFERVYLGNKTGCPKCAKTSRYSHIHRRVVEWLERKGLEPRVNCRTLAKGKEIDIVLDEQKIAIEIDGVYWHSSRFMSDESNQRLIRRKLIEDQGYRLIRLWDMELVKRPAAVTSLLTSILGLSKYRIGARQTQIRKIEAAEATAFLDKWHIQGSTSASVNLGLFYSDSLLAVMTFRRPTISTAYDWEMARFVVKGNWSIAGAASKLLSAFRTEGAHAGSIVSYADRRYSEGGLYRTLGFELIRVSKPGYFYYHQSARAVSRYSAQKHKLGKLLGDGFDAALSERQNMEANGYHRVFDCGQFVFALDAPALALARPVRIPHVEIPEPVRRTLMTIADVRAKIPERLTLITDLAEDARIAKKEKQRFRCVCGYDWRVEVASLLRNRAGGCPKCANRTSDEDIAEKLRANNPFIEYVAGFEGMNRFCRFRFIPTGIEFEAHAHNTIIVGRLPRPVRAALRELEPAAREQILKRVGKYYRDT